MNKKYGIQNQIARIRSAPKDGTGTIVRNDGFVLGLFNDNTVAGTNVIFETRDPGATGQLWTKGPADREGYYFLGNQKAKKFLTCKGSSVTIEGNLNY